MKYSVLPGYFTSRDCRSRKARSMKLWFVTAIALQRRGCGDIGFAQRVNNTENSFQLNQVAKRTLSFVTSNRLIY